MAWKVDVVGTPAACVTAVQAMTSGTGTANEVAQVARMITVIVAEINAYPNQSGALHVFAEGGLNFDADFVKLRVESVGNLGSGLTTAAFQGSAP